MSPPQRRLRADLPFRRIALTLSGGGGLGAYEVGAFRAFEQAGLEPRIVLGVSVGAINALIWVTHGFDSEPLRKVWERLRPPSVGIRWITLGARSLGAFLFAIALLQAVLLLSDVPQMRVSHWFHDSLADALAWTVVAAVGALLLVFSRPVEDALARLTPAADPERMERVIGWVLVVLAALYPLSAWLPFAWPRQFHLMVVLVGGVLWLLGRNIQPGGRMRRMLMRALPETGGRGLWRSAARRRLIDGLLPRRVAQHFDGHTHLILSACEVESGRMHYFANWDIHRSGFRQRLKGALSEAVEMRTREEMMRAALASSAVPVLFEPVHIHGRHYMDGGVFSNQPIHAALADQADALLLVLVSPSDTPPRLSHDPLLIDVAARLSQLANWRDLQSELTRVPAGWSREGDPARLCVVEPERALPGSLLTMEPSITNELLELGEADAWRALERAGWLESAPAHAGRHAP